MSVHTRFGDAAAVACPTGRLCTIVYQKAGEQLAAATFSPRDLARFKVGRLPVSDGGGEAGLACPSANECVAIGNGPDDSAQNVSVTFNPHTFAVLSSSVMPTTVDNFSGNDDSSYPISCPRADQCVALALSGTQDGDSSDIAVTFNPLQSATPTEVILRHWTKFGWPPQFQALACPAATQCVAGDATGRVIAFDPVTGTVTPALHVFPGNTWPDVAGLSCFSATDCVAVSGAAVAITLDPQTGRKRLDQQLRWSGTLTGQTSLEYQVYARTLTCPARSLCVAASSNGEAATFNPMKPTDQPNGYEHPDYNGIGSLACASATSCFGAGVDGLSAFNPRPEQL